MLRIFTLLLAAGLMLSMGAVAFADKPTTKSAEAHKPPEKGGVAPEFSLNRLDDVKISLEELRSRGPVVLVVLRGWPGYQCPICTKQVGELIKHAPGFETAGANVLLVYPGPAEDLKAHAKEFKIAETLPERFHFVIDPDYTLTNLYGLRWNEPKETAYPSTFVIDVAGAVRFAKVSKTHDGRASAEEILKTLASIDQ